MLASWTAGFEKKPLTGRGILYACESCTISGFMLKLCRYDVCYTSYIYSWEKVWNTNERYRNKKHSGKSAGTDVHAACDSTGCAGSVWEAFAYDILLLLNETVLRLKYSVLVEPQIFKKNSMLHQIAPSCRKRKRVSGTKMVGKWNSLYFFYTITRTRKLFILRQNFILWARNLINYGADWSVTDI